MNILGAIIAGIPGTIAISSVMAMAPMIGMPKMDIVDLLSTMFGKPNRLIGWMMHFMMGIVFAMIYSLFWSLGIGSATWVGGLIGHLVFGVVVALVYNPF